MLAEHKDLALATMPLGGGTSPAILRGRISGLVEKRHLVLKRRMMDRARTAGRELIDVGTDASYPWFDDYPPTRAALAALQAAAPSCRMYPSSYGTQQLRQEVVALLRRQFGVDLDLNLEVMISTGASQVFDALSRSYVGRYLLIPDLALSTVTSIGAGNGVEVVRVPLDESHRIELDALETLVSSIKPWSVRFLYLNSPTNPSGALYRPEHLAHIVEIARRHQILVLHDHDSWYTTHCGHRSANILEIPGALDVAVTVLSVSKELGLPGLRVGAVAGKRDVINNLRIHNSEFCVMIPEPCQAAAAAALRAFVEDDDRARLQRRIGVALELAIEGWQRLGWPATAILRPEAGYKFLFAPPPAFIEVDEGGDPSGVELFDFLVARDAAVKLSTARSFNPQQRSWMRMILMQDEERLGELFERLHTTGIHYDMAVPDGLGSDYMEVIGGCDLWDL